MDSQLSIITGICLIVGTFLSYFIQYFKLYRNKNNDGISHYMLVLGSLSSMTNFIGLISVETHDNDILILPLLQMITPWVCIFIFYSMFVYYAKKNHKIRLFTESLLLKTTDKNNYNFRNIKLVFFAYIIIVIILWILFGLFSINNKNNTLYYYGQTMNIIASITSVSMWIPQIIKSWKLREPGSLSIIALAIHALGCVITFVYQVFMSNQSFLIGFPYLIGAILETSVILLATSNICKKKEILK
jgi:uncharacterized protein with PQ loop repeat